MTSAEGDEPHRPENPRRERVGAERAGVRGSGGKQIHRRRRQRPQSDHRRLRPHDSGERQHRRHEEEVPRLPAPKPDKGAEDRKAPENGGRVFCGDRVRPDQVVRDERVDQGGNEPGKPAAGDDPGDEEDDEDTARIEEVVEVKGVGFVGPEELEDEADQEGPAAGVLVVEEPVDEILTVLEGAVVRHPRLAGVGDVLCHVGVDVLVVVDPVDLRGGQGDQEKAGDQNQQEIDPRPVQAVP